MRLKRVMQAVFVAAAVALLAACQPEGRIDSVTSDAGAVHIQGWARDPDTTEPIQVHVYANGRLIGTTEATTPRPDVQAATAGSPRPAGANHGFDVTMPLPPGTTQVCVYGIDRVGGDANSLIGCSGLNRCVVSLHGLGGGGGSAQTGIDGIRYLFPNGNASAGAGRRWTYDTDADYAAARASVQQVIDTAGCSRVVIDGFSNGGGFAGKLYCAGETFGGRVVGYVLDDPVTDRSADSGCARATGDNIALYWTGGLDFAGPGFDCARNGWTCDGGSLVGRDTYAARLGVAVSRSVHSTHEPYLWPPEIGRWL